MMKSSTGKYLCLMLNAQHEYLIFAKVIAVFNCLLEIHFSVGNSNLSSHCGISNKNGCHKNFIYLSGTDKNVWSGKTRLWFFAYHRDKICLLRKHEFSCMIF